ESNQEVYRSTGWRHFLYLRRERQFVDGEGRSQQCDDLHLQQHGSRDLAEGRTAAHAELRLRRDGKSDEAYGSPWQSHELHLRQSKPGELRRLWGSSLGPEYDLRKHHQLHLRRW